jgi:hypothetical protein
MAATLPCLLLSDASSKPARIVLGAFGGRLVAPLAGTGGAFAAHRTRATIQVITRGRCATIAVPDECAEQLVVLIEVEIRGEAREEAAVGGMML